MKRFKGTKGVIILIVLVALMVGYYFYLSNKSGKEAAEADKEMSAVDTVLLRDLSINYPPTVKEVVKYYGDVLLCMYSGNCSDSDLDRLAKQVLYLYDDDLVANNPWNEYILRLREDVHDYNENDRKISSYIPAGSSSVDYFSVNSSEWARIQCTFYRKEKAASEPVSEIFLLRKDDDGKWKIFGWDLSSNVSVDKTEE
ncbi:MAG: hypothetical protein J6U15_05680 [Lachnospiraceae bacterium]|nr:hypothetical protein [Lachnospiraceae bacterium]